MDVPPAPAKRKKVMWQRSKFKQTFAQLRQNAEVIVHISRKKERVLSRQACAADRSFALIVC